MTYWCPNLPLFMLSLLAVGLAFMALGFVIAWSMGRRSMRREQYMTALEHRLKHEQEHGA